ncbi:MAG: outer membrane beta-barrel protein [Bacteroidales bacterium]|jgi:hypothetical protein|nr:outer membrane beta-barrel protein [Bacteroidales bacterium]
MKKILSTLLAASLMLVGIQAIAQPSVNAGYLNSTLKVQNADPSNANGAYVGLSYNLPIAGGLGVAPGIYYSLISSKETASLGTIFSGSGTFTEHAVNVPVYLNYAIGLNRDTNFFVFGGPTLQYGLSSKVKYDANVAGISGSTTANNYDNDNYNRMNVYLGGGIGINAGAFKVTVGYDYGMMNQIKGDNATPAHRSNIKIGLGFNF